MKKLTVWWAFFILENASKKLLIITITFIGLTSFSFLQRNSKKRAINTAKDKWIEVYGESVLNKEPFFAELESDSVWHVYGSFKSSGYTVNDKGDTILSIF